MIAVMGTECEKTHEAVAPPGASGKAQPQEQAQEPDMQREKLDEETPISRRPASIGSTALSNRNHVTQWPTHNPLTHPKAFPDGGFKAWTVVFGGFMALFVSFGWINCIGVFQDYYETHTLSHYSSSTIAWIPSMETFMMYAGGIWVGRLYDLYGPRYLVLIGTFFHVFGLMMLSLSKTYYQIFLSQGVCSPIGCSMLFFSSLSSASTWFFHRRALAVGIVVSGASLGGVVLPIMIERLMPKVGSGWTLRIVAFLILGCLVLSNLTIKSRIPPTKNKVKVMDFISSFTELPFVLTTAGVFFVFWGLFLPFNYIVLQARKDGMSQRLAQYMVPLVNATGVPGRIIPSFAGDRFGRYNVMVVMSTLSALSVLALWLPARANAPIIIFTIFYGAFTGAVVALPTALVAQISDVRQIGTRVGTLYGVGSIAALTGNPIGGAIVSGQQGAFTHMQIYCGVVMMAGAAFFAAARTSLVGPHLKKRV